MRKDDRGRLNVSKGVFTRRKGTLRSFRLSRRRAAMGNGTYCRLCNSMAKARLVNLLNGRVMRTCRLIGLPRRSTVHGLGVPIVFSVCGRRLLPTGVIMSVDSMVKSLCGSCKRAAGMGLCSVILRFASCGGISRVRIPSRVGGLTGWGGHYRGSCN